MEVSDIVLIKTGIDIVLMGTMEHILSMLYICAKKSSL